MLVECGLSIYHLIGLTKSIIRVDYLKKANCFDFSFNVGTLCWKIGITKKQIKLDMQIMWLI